MPTELLAAALASCFCLAVAWAARKRRITLEDLRVDVRAERAPATSRATAPTTSGSSRPPPPPSWPPRSTWPSATAGSPTRSANPRRSATTSVDAHGVASVDLPGRPPNARTTTWVNPTGSTSSAAEPRESARARWRSARTPTRRWSSAPSSRTSPTRPAASPTCSGREIPDFERLFLAGPENYAEAGIDLRRETVVTDVDVVGPHDDRERRGRCPGTRLIVCTGWNYLLPDVPGQRPRGDHVRQEHPARHRAQRDAQRREEGRRAGGRARSAWRCSPPWPTAASRPTSSTRTPGCSRRSPTRRSPSRCRRASRSSAAMLHFGVGLKAFVGGDGRLTGVETTEGRHRLPTSVVVATHKEPETTLGARDGPQAGLDRRLRRGRADADPDARRLRGGRRASRCRRT